MRKGNTWHFKLLSGRSLQLCSGIGQMLSYVPSTFGSIQVSGDVPTLPSLRLKVWDGAGLGLGLGLGRGGQARPQKPGLIPTFNSGMHSSVQWMTESTLSVLSLLASYINDVTKYKYSHIVNSFQSVMRSLHVSKHESKHDHWLTQLTTRRHRLTFCFWQKSI